MPVRPLVAAVALALLLTSCSSSVAPSKEGAEGGGDAPPPPSETAVIADFAIPDVRGNTVRLSDSAGKVRLVDFWATWCAPCREEIPMFKELHATYGPQGLTLLAISDEDAETVRTFVDKETIPWTNLIDEGGKVAEQFGGVLGLPMAFLLDGEGKVVAKWGPGLVPRATLEPKIRELLERRGTGA